MSQNKILDNIVAELKQIKDELSQAKILILEQEKTIKSLQNIVKIMGRKFSYLIHLMNLEKRTAIIV